MKKFFKILVIGVILFLLGVASWFLYLKFSEVKRTEPISLVPSDAVFMIETSNLTAAWEKIRQTQIWQSLTENTSFDSTNNKLLKVDSILHSNKAVDLILANRQLMVSAHMISGIDYDVIFYVDVEFASKLSGLFKSLKMLNYTVTDRTYKGFKIFDITDNETQSTIYLSIINNILVGSMSNLLIEDVILRKDEKFFLSDKNFSQVLLEVSQKELIHFYINYSRFPKFIQKFTPDETNLSVMLSKMLDFSAFDVDMQNNLIVCEGFTLLKDDAFYLSALSNLTPQNSICYQLLPTNTALYLSFTFDAFPQAYKQIMQEFERNNTTEFELYQKGIKNLEREFEIDVEESFFSWIGNEIALVKTNPKFGSRNEDLIVMLHSIDIQQAEKALENLREKLQETAPISFKTKSYKNFDIHFINIKGVFRVLFGNLFESIEKPYFTIIDDFVLFSNSESTLIDFINFYIKGNTLSHNRHFTDFKDNFNIKSNIHFYIQTPHLYRHIYQVSNNEFKQELLKNKNLYLSFNYIGLQMVVDNKLLKTRLITQYDENALYNIEIEELEVSSTDELFNQEYENLEFKFELPEEQKLRIGSAKLRYENEVVKHEGKIKDGKPEGLWRSYYENARIKSAVNYEKGEATGEAAFYYDAPNEPKKATVFFDGDKIENTYTEYYKNGNIKAILIYDNGLLDGEAQFFYENGNLKIKGEYKNGLKTGKWEFYRENGEVYDKEKWKKGSKK